ncbi:MAG TPA: cysteine dioxygenase family protein [Thermoanaerobaculia bacterium]|nr:cysteine dioxygenase family protein [Thermoanaerobaculia bacterium]
MSETATLPSRHPSAPAAPPTALPAHAALIAALSRAVEADGVRAITSRVQHELESRIAAGLDLGERFRRPRPDGYARRLFHRDPAGRFSVVAMTWGPGQATPLHDHAGIWCVEGVVEGTLEVARYELLAAGADGVHRFAERGRTTAGVGSSGALIPPFEYHTLANSSDQAVAITLHVYGGDMDRCSAFEPLGEAGAYRRVEKTLSFHD